MSEIEERLQTRIEAAEALAESWKGSHPEPDHGIDDMREYMAAELLEALSGNSIHEKEIDTLRADADAAEAHLRAVVQQDCPGKHQPVQHRDGHPAWCPDCEKTSRGQSMGRLR